MSPILRITAVRAIGDRRVELSLTDGRQKVVDLDPLLHGPLFDPIRLSDELFGMVRVDPDVGTLVWPNGADICPDVLIYDLPFA